MKVKHSKREQKCIKHCSGNNKVQSWKFPKIRTSKFLIPIWKRKVIISNLKKAYARRIQHLINKCVLCCKLRNSQSSSELVNVESTINRIPVKGNHSVNGNIDHVRLKSLRNKKIKRNKSHWSKVEIERLSHELDDN